MRERFHRWARDGVEAPQMRHDPSGMRANTTAAEWPAVECWIQPRSSMAVQSSESESFPPQDSRGTVTVWQPGRGAGRHDCALLVARRRLEARHRSSPLRLPSESPHFLSLARGGLHPAYVGAARHCGYSAARRSVLKLPLSTSLVDSRQARGPVGLLARDGPGLGL